MKERVKEMKETKKMLDIIHKQYREALEQNIKNNKKKQRKEKMLTYFVASFIILITGLVLFLNYKLTSNFEEQCMAKGYSQNYCIEHS